MSFEKERGLLICPTGRKVSLLASTLTLAWGLLHSSDRGVRLKLARWNRHKK